VLKWPPALCRSTQSLAFMAARLRALAAARGQWAEDVALISPSLMAFFLRDFGDLVS
jgi:hypothetical protein